MSARAARELFLAAQPADGSLPANSRSGAGFGTNRLLALACPGRDAAVPASVMARVQGEGMPQRQMDGVSEKQ